MRETIGRFRVEEKLGEGGMGVVYRAADDVLRRSVALKMLRPGNDPTGRERLLREARAAARLTHPNICQIYEVGLDGDDLFVAMEFLQGEPLNLRVERGPVPLPEASEIVLGILAALETIHEAGLIHRDVKPTNVFLTPHGVKLLDFGLVRSSADAVDVTEPELTRPGTAVGTPRYMAPEQWAGEGVGPAADLFAAGAIYYELLAGQPAFRGASMVEVAEAILSKEPPALSGGPDVLAADRIIQRALAKPAGDRFPDAASMAGEIRRVRVGSDTMDAVPVRRSRRVAALPFRMLRPDPETDFLAFSLPDAVTASLSGIDGLVVRSTLAAAGHGGGAPDLKMIAREVDVDVILLGTLLRGGDRLRVSVQLVEAPAGTILWSQSSEVQLDDLFHLHDTLVHRIVESLAIPLTGGEEKRLSRDVPAGARAYEFYLRANQQSTAGFAGPVLAARDLYRATVEEDPGFAPAWARLGRVYRVIAKFGHGDRNENIRLSREAFESALALDPDLSLAHNFYTYFQVEEEGDAVGAMTRLLRRGRKRTSDPNLFAGLVVACRFCGLLEASLAAYHRARRLDPAIRTSVQYTYFMMGDYERVIETDNEDPPYLSCLAPELLGRPEETLARFREMERRGYEGTHHHEYRCTLAALEGDRETCVKAVAEFEKSGFRDPEGILMIARNLVRVGENQSALRWIRRSADGGFCCPTGLESDPWLAGLRDVPEFRSILRETGAARAAAARAYAEAGGEALLGVPPEEASP